MVDLLRYRDAWVSGDEAVEINLGLAKHMRGRELEEMRIVAIKEAEADFRRSLIRFGRASQEVTDRVKNARREIDYKTLYNAQSIEELDALTLGAAQGDDA